MSDINFDIMNSRVTFKNVPLHTLSKFTFKDIDVAYDEFMKIPGVDECIILQTASRVEIFTISNVVVKDTPDVRRKEGKRLMINLIKETWVELSTLEQIDIDHFDQTLEVYKEIDVYRHLLRLATGLDSVVLGKKEIYDEIIGSLAKAKAAGAAGNIISKMFEEVIRLATRMRETTEIGKNVVSLGDVAIELVNEKAGLDAKKKVLLIGTGTPAAMVAKTLNKKNISFTVTSRTIERATGFSNILGGEPVEFAEVMAHFEKYDIVLVATTSDYFLITPDTVHLALEDKKKGTLILDISDPRTVDEGITVFPGVKLLFRDQIFEAYEKSAKIHAVIVPAVEKIIEKEMPVLTAKMLTL